jgi:hypothetical protein
MENAPTPTTTTLVILFIQDEIYKHRCISIYKTVHTTAVFSHIKNPFANDEQRGFL